MNPPGYFPPPAGVFPGMPFSGPPPLGGVLPSAAGMMPLGVPGMLRPGMPPMAGMRPLMMRPGMPLFPAGAAPLVLPKPAADGAASTAAPAPAPLPPKSTTLYVGKIATSVGDDVMRALLEACGPVRSWKRVQDPETRRPKGFGFCEFEEPEGVLRALRLLGNLALDGQELLLKCNTATQKYVDEYQARKEAEAAKPKQAALLVSEDDSSKEKAGDADDGAEDGEARSEAGAEGAKEVEKEPESEEAADNRILEAIMGIVSERAATAPRPDPAAAASVFLSGLEARPGSSGRRESRERGRAAEEAALEKRYEREREAERNEAEARAYAHERAYKERLREWERHERQWREEAEKEAERERDVAKERGRQIRADLEAPDSDDELEPWARKPIAACRRVEERRRRREKEEAEDILDRQREAHEADAKRRHLEAEREEAEAAAKRAAAEAEEAAAAAEREEEERVKVDPNDPIYQAMLAASKAPKPATPPANEPAPIAVKSEPAPSPAAQAAVPQRTPPAAAQPSPGRDAGPRVPVRGAARTGLASVFGADDDEDKPRRRLIPLQYTEEELRAAQQSSAPDGGSEASAANGVAIAPVAAKSMKPQDAKSSQAAIKELIRKIPTTPEGVFNYAIDWAAFDAAQGAIAPKVEKFVAAQTAKLLGGEEAGMAGFIMKQVQGHAPPRKLLGELATVLDEEAQPLVLKLYRIVIFESQKAALGLVD